MSARRPKPTQLKERTSIRANLGLSRLFAAPSEPGRDSGAPEDDQTMRLDDPRLKQRAADLKVVERRETTQASLKFETHAAKIIRPPRPDNEKPSRFRSSDARVNDARAKDVRVNDEEYGTAVVQRVKEPKRSKKKAAPVSDDTQPLAPAGDTKAGFVNARTSVTKLKSDDLKRGDQKTRLMMIGAFVAAAALVGYALISNDGPQSHQRKSALTNDQIKERVDFYRSLTGTKLNRERMGVQMDNFKQAPSLGYGDVKVKAPDMLNGLPLVGEKKDFRRKEGTPLDPTYSEAKIGYGLQEEQDRADFDQRSNEAWKNEFVENARKDGYEVKVDEHGNVTTKEIPPAERAYEGRSPFRTTR